MRTYYLENRPGPSRKPRRVAFPIHLVKPTEVALAPAVSPDLLQQDVQGLPLEQVLVDHGPFLVLYARAEQIPHALREIGRLREATFREAGEGTGQAIDIDRFDDYYLHLFVWHKEKREIVGAYRLGATDAILDRLGKQGLYTSTLFRYRARLLQAISPALEMGRSFVRKEYQRSFSSLLLLWRGIGAFVVRNPRYKILFGPVSINDDYQSSSRQLLVTFLKMNNFMPELARMVKPRTPLRPSPLAQWKSRKMRMIVDDLEDVEELIADIETDLKGVPILLKQYLKLGGQLLGFNIDPAFSNVLDGLILVDLTKSDPRVLERYFTKEGVRSFRAYHGLATP
jgi:putative hemolysin